jgi:hypothetical protein
MNKPIPFDIVLAILSYLSYQQLYELQKSTNNVVSSYASIALKINVRKSTLLERTTIPLCPTASIRRINLTIETRPFVSIELSNSQGPSPIHGGLIQVQTRRLICDGLENDAMTFSPFHESDARNRYAEPDPIKATSVDMAWLILKIDVPSIGKV